MEVITCHRSVAENGVIGSYLVHNVTCTCGVQEGGVRSELQMQKCARMNSMPKCKVCWLTCRQGRASMVAQWLHQVCVFERSLGRGCGSQTKKPRTAAGRYSICPAREVNIRARAKGNKFKMIRKQQHLDTDYEYKRKSRTISRLMAWQLRNDVVIQQHRKH